MPSASIHDLRFLIGGDVRGDLERLFQALKPYPADGWRTIFLGDLVDYGPFGIGAVRYARDRANSTVLLGNHEVAMLWALRDPARVGFWMSIGGQPPDLDGMAQNAPLQKGMGERPPLVPLPHPTPVPPRGAASFPHLLYNGRPDLAFPANWGV